MNDLEGKVKYFLIGLMMLLIILMFREDLAYDESKWYDNCDHYWETVYHNEQVTEGYYDTDNTWVGPTYNTWTTNELRGGSFTSTDTGVHWWFTSSDLLEFGGEYYCMYAGKSMHSFEHDPGWVTHIDSHDSNMKKTFWHTNYYWEPVFGHTADFTETAGCIMYNYKEDSNSETKRGRLGVQAAIWAEGGSISDKIGGGLDDSHAQNTDFSNAQEYQDEKKFYDIEAHEKISINSVIGKTLPVTPTEGLLPDEEFYMYLDFPIIFGSVPTGTKSGTTTTYEGEFGKIEITNGTLVAVPANKAIEGSGNYQYTIKINTGDLSSNVVDINVTKYFYDYSVKILYSLCQNSELAQPTGNDGTYTRTNKQTGNTVKSEDLNFSFRINSDVAIKHYIHSIGGEDHYNSGGMMAHSGIGGRKAWDTSTKLAQPAVGELGDEIIYKIIIENYTKANIYVNIEDILPTEATFVSATHGGNGSPVNWKLVRMDEAASPTSPGNPTPNTKEITLIARMNIANYGKAISTAKIVKVFATNAETYDMKNVAKSRFNRIEEDQDAFTTKKYDISIDQYIAQVNHQETRGGTGVTYSSNTRERKDNDWKLGDPVFVEYGDVVTYKFVLYNTNYDIANSSTPWFNPDTVTVDLNFELPKKYTLRSISSTDSYDNYRENGNKVEFSKVRIGRNSTTTITLTLVAEEVKRDTTETTTLLLTEVYNRNNRNLHEANPIQNTSSRTEVKEQYKISHYDAILDEYIFTYNAEMAKYNDNYEFSTGESGEAFSEQEHTYSNQSPLNVEKYETLCYKTVITNNYTKAEKENTQASYKRYNTRVRPTLVRQTIDYGLTQYQYAIYWHHASSGKDELVSSDGNQSRIVQSLNDTGSQWIYEYEILDEEIILSPGDYLYYLSYVEVTESNMCLRNLAFRSEIVTLTNINRKNKNNRKVPNDIRIVTNENVAIQNKHVNRTNFIRLKDLIISGTVWVDTNRNGYYDNDEEGKDGIYVRLYGNINPDKPDEYVLVGDKRITEYNDKTKQHGYYNFGRVNKSWKEENGNYSYQEENRLISYFVEFEYYGQMYKATEVYGGVQSGETHGKGNLSIDELDKTISYWRQGYTDENGNPKLPQSQSITYKGPELGILGRTEYMIDSNAYEFDKVRYQFTEGNRTIGYDKAYGIDTREGANGAPIENDLSYKKEGHNSTLNEEASGQDSQIGTRMTARSFITQSYQNEIIDCDEWGKSKTNKNTDTLSLFNCSYSNSYNYPRAENQEKPIDYKTQREDIVETEYLKYINLGLVPREQIDLSMEADVYSVKTTINGEEMTYGYNANDADSTNYDEPIPTRNEGEERSVYEERKKAYEERHKNDYRLDEAYDLDLYTTDYYYRNDYYNQEETQVVESYKGTESELNTEVTYRVRITNNDIKHDEPNVSTGVMGQDNDIPVETAINELTIYYDKNFMKADNTSTVTVKEKNSETGLLEDKEQRISRINYETNTGNTGELRINDNATYPNSDGQLHDEYQVMYLTGMENLYLKEGDYVDVYITLTVDKEADTRNLKITKDDDMGLELIGEISAYTTRYKPNDEQGENGYFHQGLAGKYAALVDKDSNPGNMLKYDRDVDNDYRDYDNYEDDTYKVGIKVGLLDGQEPTPPPPEDPPKSSTERIITGMVWDDARSETVSENETAVQYLGNGEYDETDENLPEAAVNPNTKEEYNNDKQVAGVKVSLIEVVQTQAVDENGKSKYYEYPARYTYDVYDENGTKIHKKGELIETRTDGNGKYQLDHFIPGYYKVRFDYGYSYEEKDVEGNPILDTEGNPKITYYTTYNGQDYKSATYYNEYDRKLLYYNTENSYENDNIGNSENFGYFDQVKATMIGKEKEDGTYERHSDAQDDEIRRLNVNSYSETMTALQAVVFAEPENSKKRLTRNTHMYAESAIFYVKPEDIESKETHIKPLDYSDFNKDRLWRIDNLDFGLEYRPEASILLDKEISTLELVTSDKKTLIKLYFKDENGTRMIDPKKSIGYENVQFLPNEEKTKQGFVYINMDTDILEGCTIKVDYEMTATNNSEVDRINENLDAIKYEKGANDKNYGIFKVYTTHQKDENKIEYTYNANQTASELLAHKYYTSYDKTKNEYKLGYEYDASKGTEKYNYLNYLKKPYKASGTTQIDGKDANNKVELSGQEYYGMYLGQTYYTGKKGDKDVVAQLKVDHILDYVDNDFTFALSENNTKNRLWSSTTSDELHKNNLLDWNKVHNQKEGTKCYLIDRAGIRYDTDKKSNLALSVDDNKKGNLDKNRETGNITLSRFLQTQHEIGEGNSDAYGKISAVATKVISADDVSGGKGLAYENIAEVIQYTNITGRRTTLPKEEAEGENKVIKGGGIIGNANVQNWTGANQYEDDTDATEIITISPPTGLRK